MPRYRPTNEKLKALLTAHDNGEDYEMVGRALKMSKRTVDRNVQHYLKYGKQTIGTPGRPTPKMDAEMVQFLLEYLSGFPGVCELQLSSFVNDCNTLHSGHCCRAKPPTSRAIWSVKANRLHSHNHQSPQQRDGDLEGAMVLVVFACTLCTHHCVCCNTVSLCSEFSREQIVEEAIR